MWIKLLKSLLPVLLFLAFFSQPVIFADSGSAKDSLTIKLNNLISQLESLKAQIENSKDYIKALLIQTQTLQNQLNKDKELLMSNEQQLQSDKEQLMKQKQLLENSEKLLTEQQDQFKILSMQYEKLLSISKKLQDENNAAKIAIAVLSGLALGELGFIIFFHK